MKTKWFIVLIGMLSVSNVLADTAKRVEGSREIPGDKHKAIAQVTRCEAWVDFSTDGNQAPKVHVQLAYSSGETNYRSENFEGSGTYENGIIHLQNKYAFNTDSLGLGVVNQKYALEVAVDPELKQIRSLKIQVTEHARSLFPLGRPGIFIPRYRTAAVCEF